MSKEKDQPGQDSEKLEDLKYPGDEPEATEPESDLAKELEKSKSEYLYLRAEFDNYNKQMIKERSDLVKFGSERLVRDLLEVIDNFERALETEVTQETLDSFKTGIEITHKEIMSLLGRHGIERFGERGQAFDPTLHEALSSEPTDQVDEGHISQVFKPAYKMHDRVIRPAQVVVAVKPKAEQE